MLRRTYDTRQNLDRIDPRQLRIQTEITGGDAVTTAQHHGGLGLRLKDHAKVPLHGLHPTGGVRTVIVDEFGRLFVTRNWPSRGAGNLVI